MQAEDLIDSAVNHVADRQAADWDALAARATSDEARQRLECLRVIAAIGQVHQSGGTAPELPASRSVDAAFWPAPLAPDNLVGETWGRYTLLEEVGAGTFGSVYRAWDPELEREIAIKILHRHVADDELKARLLREGRALAKVRDPNIVSVLGVESNGGRVGLCMEFVHGETLDDVLQSHKTLNAREAILVGQDVCRALATVHRAGFVHRDVKARNIMRERAGRIVLMDFGTGREVEQLERAAGRGNVAGTPLYMAPEVLAGQPASACSDVYSVGVLLYHLVTGKYPVEGATLKDIRAAHMFGKRTPISERRSDLPPSFIRVVDRALTANPQQRCPSAGELLEALAAAGSEAVVARKTRVDAFVGWGAVLAGIAVGLTGLGALNSTYFNTALGRTEFANENLWHWLQWGARSIVAPTVFFIFALLGLALLLVCRRVVLGASTRARHFEKRVKAEVQRWGLDDVGNLSSCVLLVSVTALIVVWWYFQPLFGALIIYPDVSTAPADQLGFLSPQRFSKHEAYRESFIWLTIVCLVIWYPVLHLAAKKREPLSRGVVAGGVAVVVLAILMLDLPYRMLWFNTFKVAQWRGSRCYILGERADDVLLFCPRLDLPRNRIVSGRSTELERLGVEENVFTQFSSPQ